MRLRRHVIAIAMLALAAAPAGAAASAPPPEFFGLTPAIGFTPETQVSEEEWAQMSAGGVGSVRAAFFWFQIQSEDEDEFNWSRTDSIVYYATKYGMDVEPFVMGTPEWLARPSAPTIPVDSPAATRYWERLLIELVERYGPQGEFWTILQEEDPSVSPNPIDVWQVWNEPNSSTYWRPTEDAPERYAQFLKVSANAIHSRDPAARITAAGLFEHPREGMGVRRFLERFYAVPGVKKAFDALAIHPYARGWMGAVDQIRDVRAIMRRNRDGRTALRITELGWPTRFNGHGGDIYTKTEDEQARLLTEIYTTILTRRVQWNIERLFWFTWRDNNLTPNCNLCSHSGLFRRDMTPKPAWDAYVAVADAAL